VRLFPAIDIQQGRAVRLRRGDFEQATVFGDDPVALAREWRSQGAQALHVVDLDGAREGRLVNIDLVTAIAEAVDVPVQYGGGVRSSDALKRVAASPLEWVILGTSAVTDTDLLGEALALLGDRLVIGVDCEQSMVATHGWQERSEMSAQRFVRALESKGVRRIVYTDVLRDGMLEGPNLEGLRELASSTRLEIVMSGGVSTLDDLRRIRRAAPNVVAVIVGRALYEGAFTLAQATAVLEGASGASG
jgi:phosphoribosylformimino-5-aminoimidazole carboxamide ribotide isomerase